MTIEQRPTGARTGRGLPRALRPFGHRGYRLLLGSLGLSLADPLPDLADVLPGKLRAVLPHGRCRTGLAPPEPGRVDDRVCPASVVVKRRAAARRCGPVMGVSQCCTDSA